MAAGGPNGPTPMPPAGGKRILVVDDVKLFRDLVELILGGAGFEVATAASGSEALERARRQPPDLVLLDLYMPGLDGEATCRALRAEPRLADVPVVMVSSGSQSGEVARCVAAGCDDYVLKPIRRGPLLRKIIGLVDERAFERIRVPLGVRVEFGVQGSRSRDAGRAVNISAGGVFVETAAALEAGSRLALSFPLPEAARPIAALGRVAWVNPAAAPCKRDFGPGIGVAFQGLSESGRSVIARYVRRQRRVTLTA